MLYSLFLDISSNTYFLYTSSLRMRHLLHHLRYFNDFAESRNDLRELISCSEDRFSEQHLRNSSLYSCLTIERLSLYLTDPLSITCHLFPLKIKLSPIKS